MVLLYIDYKWITIGSAAIIVAMASFFAKELYAIIVNHDRKGKNELTSNVAPQETIKKVVPELSKEEKERRETTILQEATEILTMLDDSEVIELNKMDAQYKRFPMLGIAKDNKQLIDKLLTLNIIYAQNVFDYKFTTSGIKVCELAAKRIHKYDK